MIRADLWPFPHPEQAHRRKHGPADYVDPSSYKKWLRDEFGFRCVYCLERERWYPSGSEAFGVDHAKPKTTYPALLCVYDNLLYACNRCNAVKKDFILLDPCAAALADHVLVQADGTLVGLTPEGQDLIDLLGLDQGEPRRTRLRILRFHSLLLQHANSPEAEELWHDLFGYPDDLPNLADLRPPNNSRPEGVADCYYQQRVDGRLPQTY